ISVHRGSSVSRADTRRPPERHRKKLPGYFFTVMIRIAAAIQSMASRWRAFERLDTCALPDRAAYSLPAQHPYDPLTAGVSATATENQEYGGGLERIGEEHLQDGGDGGGGGDAALGI